MGENVPVSERRLRRPGGGSASLMKRIAVDRDEAAMEELYRWCHRGVYAAAYVLSRDHALSEDAFQETMLYVWQHASDYRGSGSPLSWIHIIARHTMIDLLRSRKSWDPLDENVYDTRTLETVENTERKNILLDQIARLDPLDAAVLTLVDLVGLSVGETADVLELSYRSTSYRHRKAKRLMKTYLSEAERGADA